MDVLNNNIEISIIVPVFNAEKTLYRCIDSILCQTFSSWELILIDDGSSDNSVKICKLFAKKDSRILFFSQEHGGAGKARNKGLNIAKGKYVTFVDSDDYIDVNYLFNLYQWKNYDLVIVGYTIDYFNEDNRLEQQQKRIPDAIKVMNLSSQKKNLLKLFENGYIHINCNKLFQKEIIDKHDIHYYEYPINEDYIFVLNYMQYCNSLVCVSTALYHWCKKVSYSSAVEKIYNNMIDIYILSHQITQKFFSPNDEYAEQIMYNTYVLIAYKISNNVLGRKITYCYGRNMFSDLLSRTLVKNSLIAHQATSMGDRLLNLLLRKKMFMCFLLFRKLKG